MDTASDSQHQAGPPPSEFPKALANGATVLLCAPDPTDFALSLRCLSRFGDASDSAIIVSTKEGRAETIETYTSLGESTNQLSINIVDMVSKKQSISATYEEVPSVFTPSEGDVERLILALSELTGPTTPSDGDRHLVVRSLSPMLAEVSVEKVIDIIERISGLRTETGLAIFGLDYTAHATETVRRVANEVDYVLWVTEQADGNFDMDLQPTRTGFSHLSVD